MNAIKESPLENAQTFGREAVWFAKHGAWMRARDYALTAAHFGRLHIESIKPEPDEAPRNNACVECGRPSVEQCDDCGLPVCNWSVGASIQGPEESCWQQHLAGHEEDREPEPTLEEFMAEQRANRDSDDNYFSPHSFNAERDR